MDDQLAVVDDRRAAMEVRSQVNQIQYLLNAILRKGEHYDTIPGTQKLTLMQSGAEKIAYMFHLVPDYKMEKESIEGFPGHREYTCTCTLYKDGVRVGTAIASCSTMESRYRWRDGYEDTGQPIPSDARDRKQEYRRQGFGMKKVNGNWVWVRFIERQENPDIADTWNTVCQMAQKRAFVRAVRSTTAASDIFTQDIEDVPAEYVQSDYEVPNVDEDRAELGNMVDTLVRAGYEQSSCRRHIWDAYKGGGIAAARDYVSTLIVTDVAPDSVDF